MRRAAIVGQGGDSRHIQQEGSSNVSEIHIRGAGQDDATAIAEIHVASWRVAYKGLLPDDFLARLDVEKRAERWSEIIAEGVTTTMVATRGDRIGGFSSYGSSRDDDCDAEQVGEILALYVHPDCWRSGMGRTLCESSLRALGRLGFNQVTLWVLNSNRRAIDFYEAMGFIDDGKTKTEQHGHGVELREARYRRQLGAKGVCR